MVNRKRLIMNTALLTGSSLAMSAISMAFQVWLAGRIGSAGIGLYQLVLSVAFLCTTFAVSGIRFAATRLVSEELGHERSWSVAAAMRRCFAYSLFFGLSAMAVLFSFAEPIGFLWIGDARTVKSLKLIAFSMPFLSLSSVMSGYFTACGRVWKPTVVHLGEQLITIGFVAYFLAHSPAGDIEKNCAAVMLGNVCGDVISFVCMLLFYLTDRHSVRDYSAQKLKLTSRMLKVALPLAVSAYARSALSTLEHLLVPRGLKAAGFSADRALSGYGVIQGMVLPIVSFPACILMALAELIIPELTEAQVRGNDGDISKTVSLLIKKGLGYSSAVALVLFVFADKLGVRIYSSPEAGDYLRLLAPLIPIMYTDMVADGCLKGLGQQLWCMGINLLDALLGVLLVWQVLPVFALKGYICIIYFNECLNFALSIMRLRKVTKIRLFS
ncbi:mATE domain protein [Firmicutes bacterium CAG:555]|nr:mATE domain protein [Firmicutes bacterium CAG:555]